MENKNRMSIIQPVEVMLRGIEEVKLFLLSNPDEDRALTKPNLISYALVKLTKTGRMYAKGIEKWQNRTRQYRRKWAKFSALIVEDYERHITKTGVTTMGQEVYGTAMHAAEDLTNTYFLTEAVTKYADRATQAEERMAHTEEIFEETFAMMSMQQPPQPTYYPKKSHTPHT